MLKNMLEVVIAFDSRKTLLIISVQTKCQEKLLYEKRLSYPLLNEVVVWKKHDEIEILEI